MGTAERRERERQKRRDDILNAAEKVFFEKGYANATMDHVAEEAELSKGTIYLYFNSKEDLFFGIAHRAFIILKNSFAIAVKQQKTGIEKLKSIGKAYYKFSQDYPDYFSTTVHFEVAELNVQEMSAAMSESHALGEEIMEIVAGAIGAGIEDGTIRSDLEPMKIAFLLRGQSNGVIQLAFRLSRFEHAPVDSQELMDAFLDLMVHALSRKNV